MMNFLKSKFGYFAHVIHILFYKPESLCWLFIEQALENQIPFCVHKPQSNNQNNLCVIKNVWLTVHTEWMSIPREIRNFFNIKVENGLKTCPKNRKRIDRRHMEG